MGPFDAFVGSVLDPAGQALDVSRVDAGNVSARAGGDGWRPGPSWPRRDQLGYVRELVLAALLVLAAPWLVHALVTRPGRVLSR